MWNSHDILELKGKINFTFFFLAKKREKKVRKYHVFCYSATAIQAAVSASVMLNMENGVGLSCGKCFYFKRFGIRFISCASALISTPIALIPTMI